MPEGALALLKAFKRAEKALFNDMRMILWSRVEKILEPINRQNSTFSVEGACSNPDDDTFFSLRFFPTFYLKTVM